MRARHAVPVALLLLSGGSFADDLTPDAGAPPPADAAGAGPAAPPPGAEPPEAPIVAAGQDIADLSLEDLLAQPVAVASRRNESARAASAVITVFTREEIVASGARDLSDLLWLVPGFSQNLDVENVTGLAVRGIWSYEGKVLLMVDGVDMTDLLYSVNPLGMHYLTSNMERVEIIRGPGSAMYGGNAGMAVISIITRGAKELEGFQVDGRYGQLTKTYSDRSVGLNVGKTFGELGVSLTGYWGQGNRSEGTYRSPGGEAWSLADHAAAATDPLLVNAAVTWRGLRARFLYDNYRLGSVDGLGNLTTVTTDGVPVPGPNSSAFETVAGDLRYAFQVTPSLTVEPRLFYKRQRPWLTTNPAESLFFDKVAQRLGGAVTVTWDATEAAHLLGGLEVTHDDAFVNHPELVGTQSHTDYSAISADPLHAQLTNLAAFAQLQWDTAVANLTVGGRAEWHSAAGFSVVPRVVVTKAFERLTAKLLFSGAFRAPGFENLNTSQTGALKPELLWVGEGALSYQATDWAVLSLNAFAVELDQPIVYTVNPDDLTQGYVNSGHVGSRGVEAEVQLRGAAGFARASVSLAEASPGTAVANFQLPDTRSQLWAMPGVKLTLLGHLALPWGFSLNTSAFVLGERGGLLADGTLGRAPAVAVVNANLRWDAPAGLLRGLGVAVGVDNLFDGQLQWLQAYDGGHPALPARGRDFFVRLGYEHGL